MTWASENLRPASFRGVGFKVAAHEAGLGKSVVVHEFPNRDRPYIEELGRTAREFDFDAYLVGSDYLTQRDALIDALLQEGPGELVHPWFGTIRAHGRATRVRETAGDLRMCRLALSFVEAGVAVAAESRPDGAGAIDAAGSVLLGVAEQEFAAVLANADKPGAAAEGAADGWRRVSKTLQGFDLGGLSSKAAAWRVRLESLTDNVLDQISRPSQFTSEVRALFRSLDEAFGSRKELIRLLLRLSRDELGRTPVLHFGGPSADAGAIALSSFVARDAATEAARLSVLFDWETYDDAVGARDAVVVILERLADSSDDATFGRTQALIAEVVEHIPSSDANLPRLDTIVLQRSRAAVVLAYQLYASTDRESEIVARNRVKNPAFLPTLVPLQVLVDIA